MLLDTPTCHNLNQSGKAIYIYIKTKMRSENLIYAIYLVPKIQLFKSSFFVFFTEGIFSNHVYYKVLGSNTDETMNLNCEYLYIMHNTSLGQETRYILFGVFLVNKLYYRFSYYHLVFRTV